MRAPYMFRQSGHVWARCRTAIHHFQIKFKSNSTRAPCRQHYRKPVPIAFLCKRKPQSHLYFRQWTKKNEAKQQQLSSRDISGCFSPPTPLILLFNLSPVCAFLATENHTAEVTGKLVGTAATFGYQRKLPQPGEASTSFLPILAWGRGDCGWRKQRNEGSFLSPTAFHNQLLLFLFTPGPAIQQVQIEDDKSEH